MIRRGSTRRRVRVALLALAAACATPRPAGAGAGIAGADVLKMPVEARGWGLATAYSAIADDAGAMGYNPAGLALSGERELRLTYLRLIGGANYESALAAYPLGRWGSAGLLLQFRQLPEVDNYGHVPPAQLSTWREITNRSVSASDAVVGGYLATRFSHLLPGVRFVEPVALGLGLKKVSSSLGAFSASTVLTDLGLRVTFDAVRFGVSLMNAGGGYRFQGATDPEVMPTTLRSAIAIVPIEDAASSLALTLENASYIGVTASEKQADDTTKSAPESLDLLAVAAEYWRLKKMGVRVGYVSPWGEGAGASSGLRGFAFGASFRIFTSWAAWQMDIAYRPLSLGAERQDAGTASVGLRF